MDDFGTTDETDFDGTTQALHTGAFAFTPDFPAIRSLDDVAPYLRPDSGIQVHRHTNGLTIVDYAITNKATFQTAIDLECRGLVFDTDTGALLSRPLHKFFRLGERQTAYDLDFDQPFWVEEKIDGSMVAAFVRNDGEIVFHTSGGVQKQALKARETGARSPGVFDLVREAYDRGFTPIFEWTSPDNRIVLDYAAEALTLLAVRNRTTGVYLSRDDMADLATRHGVSVANAEQPAWSGPQDLIDLASGVRGRLDEEGIVVAFADGNRVKVKTDQYLDRHRIINGIDLERNAMRAWLTRSIDDITAILDPVTAKTLVRYEAEMNAAVLSAADTIDTVIAETSDLDMKSRARLFPQKLPKDFVPPAFGVARGHGDAVSQITRVIEKSLSSLEKRHAAKAAFGLPDWTELLAEARASASR